MIRDFVIWQKQNLHSFGIVALNKDNDLIPSFRLISRDDITGTFGMSRPLQLKEQALGHFPRPIKISSAIGKSAAVMFLEHEVLDYFKSRIAASRPDLDVHALFNGDQSATSDRE